MYGLLLQIYICGHDTVSMQTVCVPVRSRKSGYVAGTAVIPSTPSENRRKGWRLECFISIPYLVAPYGQVSITDFLSLKSQVAHTVVSCLVSGPRL